MKVEQVTSADGTSIAFERSGAGPALVLIGGAFCDRRARSAGTPLAALLAHRYTVYSYDRRGRGDSTDIQPYTPDREVEDLAALLGAAGGSAYVYGISSGAVLALDAAVQQLPVSKLAVYDPPLLLDASRSEPLAELSKQLVEEVAAGHRARAVELFLTQIVQMPARVVAQMRNAPLWQGLELLAHTLDYDVRISARGVSLLGRAGAVRSATLVMDGEAVPPWMRDAANALAAQIPFAQRRTLAGQTHDVDVNVLAGALDEFFSS